MGVPSQSWADQTTILLVEDDASLRLSLTLLLRSRGYRVLVAKSGWEASSSLTDPSVDLVLLDLMLPGMNGYEILAALREHSEALPVILVTAKGEEADRVQGLRSGADDYVVKPFGAEELLARIEAVLRRAPQSGRHEKSALAFGNVTVDFESCVARVRGERVELTALELRLLRYFDSREGAVVTRQQILDSVWGHDFFGTERTVDNFVNRLRSKFEPEPRRPAFFVTVRSIGYRFDRSPER